MRQSASFDTTRFTLYPARTLTELLVELADRQSDTREAGRIRDLATIARQLENDAIRPARG